MDDLKNGVGIYIHTSGQNDASDRVNCTTDLMNKSIKFITGESPKLLDKFRNKAGRNKDSGCDQSQTMSYCYKGLLTEQIVEILDKELLTPYAADYSKYTLKNYEWFRLYWDIFKKQCASGNPTTSTNAADIWIFENGSTMQPAGGAWKSERVVMGQNKTGMLHKKWYLNEASESEINWYPHPEKSSFYEDTGLTCNKLFASLKINFSAYIKNHNDYLTANPGVQNEPVDTSSSGTDQDGTDEQCSATLKGFGWLFCPGASLLESLVNDFLGWIDNSLKWTLLSENNSDVAERWQSFLNIANIIFAIVFMIMIYSMATSTGLSNYDIKKILPRLIVVVVAVNLSFYICAALVDITNIAGQGIKDLLSGQAKTDWVNLSLAENLVGTVGVILGFIFFGGAALIALAIIFIAIIVRQIVLTILVVISPVAFALSLLPNTQKWFKKWQDTFIKLLLIYPMFMAVWGGAIWISALMPTEDGGAPGFMTKLICMIAPAIAIIPLFKMSGGIMAAATGYASGKLNATGAAKKINKLTRNNPATRTATKGISNITKKAGVNWSEKQFDGKIKNSTIGTATRFVGRKALGLSNAAGKHASSIEAEIQALDNSAMEQAKSQIAQYNDGRLIKIVTGEEKSDQYLARAAMNAVGEKLSVDDTEKMVIHSNNKIAVLQKNGNAREANNLQNAAISAADSSGNFQGRKSDLNKLGAHTDPNWYDNSIANKISSSSPNDIAKMSSKSLKRAYDALSSDNIDKRAKDGAIDAIIRTRDIIASDANLQANQNAEANTWMRNISELNKNPTPPNHKQK